MFRFSFSREHQVHRKGLCTGFLCLQQKLPARWVSCILLQYHFLSACPLLSEAPLPRCCGHPDLRISFPTPTTDSSSCCEGQQLSTLSCQLSVGMPSTVRSLSPKVMLLPCTTHRHQAQILHPSRGSLWILTSHSCPKVFCKRQSNFGSCRSLLLLNAETCHKHSTCRPGGKHFCELKL